MLGFDETCKVTSRTSNKCDRVTTARDDSIIACCQSIWTADRRARLIKQLASLSSEKLQSGGLADASKPLGPACILSRDVCLFCQIAVVSECFTPDPVPAMRHRRDPRLTDGASGGQASVQLLQPSDALPHRRQGAICRRCTAFNGLFVIQLSVSRH